MTPERKQPLLLGRSPPPFPVPERTGGRLAHEPASPHSLLPPCQGSDPSAHLDSHPSAYPPLIRPSGHPSTHSSIRASSHPPVHVPIHPPTYSLTHPRTFHPTAHLVQMPRHVPCWAAHPRGAAPSPAASLAERVESGQAAVTLPARHGGLAGAGARVVTLQAQGAWGRGEGTGIRGRSGVRLAAGAEAAHRPGGSRRAGRASGAPSGRSSRGRAGSAARPCGAGSGGSARRGPCCGRAAGRTCTAPSGRCSCTLWAGGGGVSGRGMWRDGSPCPLASFCGGSRQLGEGQRWSSGPA